MFRCKGNGLELGGYTQTYPAFPAPVRGSSQPMFQPKAGCKISGKDGNHTGGWMRTASKVPKQAPARDIAWGSFCLLSIAKMHQSSNPAIFGAQMRGWGQWGLHLWSRKPDPNRRGH